LARDPEILILSKDNKAIPAVNLQETALKARRKAESGLNRILSADPLRIRIYDDKREFQRYMGNPAGDIAAVANPKKMEIVILNRAWSGLRSADQVKLLTHEMAHLIIDKSIQSPIPDWLNEGLAMITAHELNPRDGWRISLAGTFGTLIPLSRLEQGMIYGGFSRPLAYAQCRSITQFYLEQVYPDEPDYEHRGARLLEELSLPGTGEILSARFWDRHFSHSLEKRWQRQYSWFWDLLAALSGSSVVMAMGSLLLGLAYWRKLRLSRQKMEKFDDDMDLVPGAVIEPEYTQFIEGDPDGTKQ
jgi:hypothetical protein